MLNKKDENYNTDDSEFIQNEIKSKRVTFNDEIINKPR